MRRSRELVNAWLPRLDPGASILLAGGDAARVQRELEQSARIAHDLVFPGLARVELADD